MREIDCRAVRPSPHKFIQNKMLTIFYLYFGKGANVPFIDENAERSVDGIEKNVDFTVNMLRGRVFF